ncbi:MAG: glycosyltransferase family 39 protein [Kiritimatiellia bacterium]
MTSIPHKVNRFAAFAAPAAAALLAGIVLFTSPYCASDLDIVPDSVEYAVGAVNALETGSYHIVVDNTRYPPRYTPWFSLIFLSPAYALLGTGIGNGIYPVFLFATAGIVIAFLIGRKAAGAWGGLFASLALLALPLYREYSGVIMTDVPSTVLVLGGCLLYVRMRRRKQKSAFSYLDAGILTALAAGLRPALGVMVLPFILLAVNAGRRAGRLVRTVLLVIPPAAAAVATLRYNALTFGSPWRSGYNFWCPVPYDYPGMVFSPVYLGANSRAIASSGLLALLLCGLVLLPVLGRIFRSTDETRSPAPLRPLAEYAALVSAFLILPHLFYFHSEPRFFLPAFALLLILTASAAAVYIRKIPVRMVLPILLAGAVFSAAGRFTAAGSAPLRRLTADRLKRRTPDNALIVSAVDPAYLEHMVSSRSSRTIVPVSRRVEYADKLIAPGPIADPVPPPEGPLDHRCPGLRAGGAGEAVRYTALEKLPELAILAGTDVPVYIETGHFTPAETAAFFEYPGMELCPVDVCLYRVRVQTRTKDDG